MGYHIITQKVQKPDFTSLLDDAHLKKSKFKKIIKKKKIRYFPSRDFIVRHLMLSEVTGEKKTFTPYSCFFLINAIPITHPVPITNPVPIIISVSSPFPFFTIFIPVRPRFKPFLYQRNK